MERFAIVFLAASGCLWNAEVVTQGVSVGVVDSAVDFGDVVGWDIATAIAPDVANVVVTAARVQTCTRLSYDIYDEYAHERLVTVPLDLGQGDAGRHTAGVFAAVFVVIGVATLAVSAIEVAASQRTKTRKSRLLGESRTTCEHAVANAPVDRVLPSGAVLTAATDMDGRAHFTIPANEPDFGTVITRVSESDAGGGVLPDKRRLRAAPRPDVRAHHASARAGAARAAPASDSGRVWRRAGACVVRDGNCRTRRCRVAVRTDPRLRERGPHDRSRALRLGLCRRARHREVPRFP